MNEQANGLSGFLLARIAEDEADASETHLTDCVLDHIDGNTTACVCGRPARVLAECKAKRELIALNDRGYDMEPAMMYLARVYSDHPDFDEGLEA